jgi:chromatin remodeling complex protein RSC6
MEDTKDIDEDEVEDVVAEIRQPKIKKRPTIEDHIQKYAELFELVDSEIDRKKRSREKGVRVLQKVKNTIKSMRKELHIVARCRRAKEKRITNGISGLQSLCIISSELATFLKVPKDTQMSRIDVTRAICVYSRLSPDEDRETALKWKHLNPKGKRDLQNEADKKAIIPDEHLAKLLNYAKYKKDVSKGLITKKVVDKETQEVTSVKVKEPTLYYWVIQKLINRHITSCSSKPKLIKKPSKKPLREKG